MIFVFFWLVLFALRVLCHEMSLGASLNPVLLSVKKQTKTDTPESQ